MGKNNLQEDDLSKTQVVTSSGNIYNKNIQKKDKCPYLIQCNN